MNTTWTLKKPKMVSKKLKRAFRVPDLSGMLKVFKGEESQEKCVSVEFLYYQGKMGEWMLFLD